MNGATVHAYSKAKDGSVNLTKNFKVKEFACKDGSDTIFISAGLAAVLQQIRSHFGKPVTITSGYRTEAYNRTVKNASKTSRHLYGLAADIVVQGVSADKVADYVETLLPNTGGVGRYKGFTHVDVRKGKSRWKG